MPTELEEPRTDYDQSHDPEEFEGGPVKTFLEHLEDLRWVLIKTLTAVGVAFLVCLLAGPYVTKVLKWPLERAKIKHPKNVQVVSFFLGETNRLGIFHLPVNQNSPFNFGTNQFVSFQLVPVPSGTNMVLGLVPRTVPGEESESLGLSLDTLSPVGGFVVATKVAIYGGLVLASPFVFYFVASFIFPALKMMERKYVYRGLVFGGGLFLTGISFCYFILMPIALTASVQFSEWLGFTVTFWRAEDYMSFVCKFMLGMGLGFELPVVILVLVKLGILTYSMLVKGRRYMIVISFVLGAVLTTPEVVTQVLMAIPLLLLYEITIWVAWYWERQEKKRALAAGEGSPA
jgi:sec-independent protein translocase protein TatC